MLFAVFFTTCLHKKCVSWHATLWLAILARFCLDTSSSVAHFFRIHLKQNKKIMKNKNYYKNFNFIYIHTYNVFLHSFIHTLSHKFSLTIKKIDKFIHTNLLMITIYDNIIIGHHLRRHIKLLIHRIHFIFFKEDFIIFSYFRQDYLYMD